MLSQSFKRRINVKTTFVLLCVYRACGRHGINISHHLYGDDTQIYMSLSVSNANESLERLQQCLMGVSARMTGSKLKLNPGRISS